MNSRSQMRPPAMGANRFGDDVGAHEVPLAFHADSTAVGEKLNPGLRVRNRDRGPGSSDAAPGHVPRVFLDPNEGVGLPRRLREAVWRGCYTNVDAQLDSPAPVWWA